MVAPERRQLVNSTESRAICEIENFRDCKHSLSLRNQAKAPIWVNLRVARQRAKCHGWFELQREKVVQCLKASLKYSLPTNFSTFDGLHIFETRPLIFGPIARYSIFTRKSIGRQRESGEKHHISWSRAAFVFATASFPYRSPIVSAFDMKTSLNGSSGRCGCADNRYAVRDTLISCSRKHCEEINFRWRSSGISTPHTKHKNFSISLALMIQKAGRANELLGSLHNLLNFIFLAVQSISDLLSSVTSATLSGFRLFLFFA